MMRIFSAIKIAIMAAALFCFSSVAMADLEADKQLLCSKLRALPEVQQKGWDKFSVTHPNDKTVYIEAEHNTARHDYFKLYWTYYFFQISETEFGPTIELTVKRYRNFCDGVGGRGLEIYAVQDVGADSNPDAWIKDYYISAVRDNTHYFLCPQFPDGFVNVNWYKFTKEEAIEKYQEVVSYFLNLLHNTGG